MVTGTQLPLDAPAKRLADAVHQRNLERSAAVIEFGRYQLIRTLGRGGMGIVFEAHDPAVGRRIALKLLSLPPARAAKVALKEARSLGRLADPNVVQVYDVGEIDGTFYIAMEHVDGVDLRDWLARGRRDADEILDVYLAAGRGLAAAHAAGVVHCDFKPANVLLANDGRILVVDFGIAAWLDDEQDQATFDDGELGLTASDGLTHATRRGLGTRGYIAPERLERGLVDPRGDQYSFCVALSEVLGGDARDRSLRAVLERGLAREPEDRFVDMNGLLDALAAARARRRPRTWTAGRSTGLAVGLALASMTFGIARVRPPARHATAPAPTIAAMPDYSEQERDCELLDELIADVRTHSEGPSEISRKAGTLLDFAGPRTCPAEFRCVRLATLYWLAQARQWDVLDSAAPARLDMDPNVQAHWALQLLLAMTTHSCKTEDDLWLTACLTEAAVRYEDAICADGLLDPSNCVRRLLHKRARIVWLGWERGDLEPELAYNLGPRMYSLDPGGPPGACSAILDQFHAATRTEPR